jgi:hypothetical protein
MVWMNELEMIISDLKPDRDARKAQRNTGPDLAYTMGSDQFFHLSPTSHARNYAGGGSQASGGGLPPGGRGPPKGFSFGAGVDRAGIGNDSGQNDSSTAFFANDPLKGLQIPDD